jgi:creatinine amidohydrolase
VYLRDVLGRDLLQVINAAKFAVLSFGAVEDHGPLGTLGMDTYPCVYLAEQVARRLGGVVLPTVEYGHLPNYTRDRVGSVPVRHEILVGLLEDIVGAAYRHGLPGVVIINGNGPNSSVVEAVAERITPAHPDRFLLLVNCWDVLSDAVTDQIFPEGRSGGHAGAWEVSVMHALLPETIADVTGWADTPFRPSVGRGSKLYGAAGRGIDRPDWIGYEGAIGTSSAEKGRRVLEATADVITEMLRKALGVVSRPPSPSA